MNWHMYGSENSVSHTINATSELAIITHSIYVCWVFTGSVLDSVDRVMNKMDNVNAFKEFTF